MNSLFFTWKEMVHRFFRRGPLPILVTWIDSFRWRRGGETKEKGIYAWYDGNMLPFFFFLTSINWNIFAVDTLTTEMSRVCSWGARAWQVVPCPTAKLWVLVVRREGRGQAKLSSCLNLRLSYLISKFKTIKLQRHTLTNGGIHTRKHTQAHRKEVLVATYRWNCAV